MIKPIKHLSVRLPCSKSCVSLAKALLLSSAMLPCIASADSHVTINPAAIIITIDEAVEIASQQVSGRATHAAIEIEEEMLVWEVNFVSEQNVHRRVLVETSSGVVVGSEVVIGS